MLLRCALFLTVDGNRRRAQFRYRSSVMEPVFGVKIPYEFNPEFNP
jgi:hypothetical protein